MTRSRVMMVRVVALLLIAAACGSSEKETKTLGANDAGKTVNLSVGDTLEVVLEANPSTGFSWEPVSLDTSILKQVGEPAFTPASTLVGAGGKMTLRFEAVGSGQTTLQLVYHRTWETGVPPEKTFSVTVVVK